MLTQPGELALVLLHREDTAASAKGAANLTTSPSTKHHNPLPRPAESAADILHEVIRLLVRVHTFGVVVNEVLVKVGARNVIVALQGVGGHVVDESSARTAAVDSMEADLDSVGPVPGRPDDVLVTLVPENRGDGGVTAVRQAFGVTAKTSAACLRLL